MPLINTVKLLNDQKKVKDEMRKLCNDALARDDKCMTEQEGTRYQELEVENRKLQDQIDLANRNNALEMETGTENRNAPGSDPDGDGSEDDDQRSTSEKTGINERAFVDYLMNVRNAGSTGIVDPDFSKRAITGMGTTSAQDGGFLVDIDVEREIMRLAMTISQFAPLCQMRRISANSNGTSWFQLKEKSRADGFRHGGILAYWTAEGETVDPKKPEFEKKKMELAKLMAFVYATQEQLDDAMQLVDEVMNIVPDEFAFQLDSAIMEGPGGGRPLGILNSPALVSVAAENNQSAGTIVLENVQKMMARMPAASFAKPTTKFYVNQDAMPQLMSMAFVVGTSGIPVYLPGGNISGAPFGTLLGKPIEMTEHCKTVGTKGDIVLADFTQYRLIQKGDLKKDASMHVRFLYDEQVFRFVKRMNGKPTWDSTLTPKNGTGTLSPFVALASRS